MGRFEASGVISGERFFPVVSIALVVVNITHTDGFLKGACGRVWYAVCRESCGDGMEHIPISLCFASSGTGLLGHHE